MAQSKHTRRNPYLQHSILKDDSNGFAIENLQVLNPEMRNLYHFHDVYEIYYLYEGERYYFIENTTYQINRGSLVLIKPYAIHCCFTSANYGFSRCLIHFTEDYLSTLLELTANTSLKDCFQNDIHVIKLTHLEQQFVENLLNFTVDDFASKNTDSDSFFKASLIQLLLLANRSNNKVKEVKDDYFNATHKTITDITAYMNDNFSDSITLASVAQRFYISTSHLVHIFKKYTGFTFIEYLNNVRIKEAQKLLVQSDMSIADIAETVGYKSNTHFTRTFKSITDISPISYRNEHSDL